MVIVVCAIVNTSPTNGEPLTIFFMYKSGSLLSRIIQHKFIHYSLIEFHVDVRMRKGSVRRLKKYCIMPWTGFLFEQIILIFLILTEMTLIMQEVKVNLWRQH